MRQIITLKENKGNLTCTIPIHKEQWIEILNDSDIVTPEWRRLLMSFYYMPNHRATCKQCSEKYGESVNTYNSGISALGATIVKKLDIFSIIDAEGKEKFWPVVMGEGKSVKGEIGVFQWTLRPELVEAIREITLREAITQYTFDFQTNWKKEDYKWKALKTFQDNWDVDAPDFADMLSRALKDTQNLLASMSAFPRGMIKAIAKEAPDEARRMFINLYDESKDLEVRIQEFINSAEDLRKKYNPGDWNMHYQNSNVVTTYLWLRFPEKYYIYKYSEYKSVAEKIGFDDIPKRNGNPEEVIKGYSIYNKLQNIVEESPELLNIYNTILTDGEEKYYKPDGLATLTFDFGFWISRFYQPTVAVRQPKTWIYAPGEGAEIWQDCQSNGIMSIGWAEVGDLSLFDTKEELDKAYDETFPNSETSNTNSKLCLWEFSHVVNEGDVVFAKDGRYKIIGRGVVESEYIFDSSRTVYPNVRRVKWTHVGEWDVKNVLDNQLPMKTLTEISHNQEWEKKVMDTITNSTPVASEPPANFDDNDKPRYWWLVANPKYWSFSDLKVGQTVDYTVKNDKGNKRRIPANFEAAREDDIVIGYEANPVKKIVSLSKVVKASDGETITFEKTEDLETPIPWTAFKDLDELRDMEFIKNQNGSFFKLTPEEYEIVINLIRQENPEPEKTPIKKTAVIEPYSKEKFLEEVFMSQDSYDELTALVRLKKNVILQGAPGVGKTFSAKRIAYSMMGEKDESRIEIVQFHQNYSYEDFIMGYKPNDNGGFELKTGVFYNFCKKAENDPEEDYFFIIDEINRGNLSKIFGELLMLIEKDYRGIAIKLAYRNELFSVPKNLHIIGMMNTADRSLAMIDYALRRRFSFYPMKPGLDTDGFRKELAKHSDERIAKVVEAVKQLNEKIAADDSLGEGFCIGHSYFCGQNIYEPWIENVVRFDLCPMLDEYWFDSKEKCQGEKNKLLELLK